MPSDRPKNGGREPIRLLLVDDEPPVLRVKQDADGLVQVQVGDRVLVRGRRAEGSTQDAPIMDARHVAVRYRTDACRNLHSFSHSCDVGIRNAHEYFGALAAVQACDRLTRRYVLVHLDERLRHRAALWRGESRVRQLQPRRLDLLRRSTKLRVGRFRQRARRVQLGARSTLTFIEIARTIVIGVRIAPLCLGTGEAGPRLVEPHLEVPQTPATGQHYRAHRPQRRNEQA